MQYAVAKFWICGPTRGHYLRRPVFLGGDCTRTESRKPTGWNSSPKQATLAFLVKSLCYVNYRKSDVGLHCARIVSGLPRSGN